MKRTIAIGVVLVLALLVGGGVLLYQRFLGDTAPASGPISAVPLAPEGAAPGALLFQIVPEKSQARFTIPEVLRGQPNTVVGKSNQVAGQIAVAPNDLPATKVGVIRIDARTLETNSAQRNRAIRNF